MSKTKSSQSQPSNRPSSPPADKPKRSFLWPYGAMLAMLAVIVALVVYLAVQTYSAKDDPGQAKTDQAAGAQTNQTAGGTAGGAPGGADVSDPAAGASEAPVATANGLPISRKNFTDMLTMSQNQRLSSGQGTEGEEPSMDLKLEVLNSLVTMAVAVQEAYDLGFGPSELEVESAINQMVGEYGSREAFENALPAFGTDMATLRKQVTDNLAIRAWRDTAFIKDALASEEEIKKFYDEHLEEATHDDQVRAVRIMLPVPLTSGQEDPQSKAAVKARADAIYQEALAGANFDELVERYMDPTTRAASQGGQMGWVSRGSLDFSALEKVLFSTEPGQVAPPVEDQFSYHIVKVLETRPAGVMAYEELMPEIKEYLLTVKTEELFLEALRAKRESAEIVVLDPAMAEAWPAFLAKLNAPPTPTPPAPEAEAPAAE